MQIILDILSWNSHYLMPGGLASDAWVLLSGSFAIASYCIIGLLWLEYKRENKG